MNREGEACDYIFLLSEENDAREIFVAGSTDSEYLQVRPSVDWIVTVLTGYSKCRYKLSNRVVQM